MTGIATEMERRSAVQDLTEDIYAATSQRSNFFKWKTIVDMLSKWNLSPLPPTREAVVALGAALKRGGYRSAESYLSLLKVRAERQGYGYDAGLLRLHRDVVRSCKRGMGAPVKPKALPFAELHRLEDADEPWVAGGPVGSGAAIVLGAWFMMREVELATTRACLVSVSGVGADTKVEWSLPVSKNDTEAVGVSRSHGCSCGSSRSARCPAHVAQLQLARLERLFPEKFREGKPIECLPMFPAADGSVVAKEDMVATIETAAKNLGVDLLSADGSERVSGHSLRVTGAQGLSRAGVECWAIQLLGRWGSDAVLGYVRAVPLERSTLWARSIAMEDTLEHVVKEALRKGMIAAGLGRSAAQQPAGAATSSSSSSFPLEASLAHEVALAKAPESEETKFVRSLIGVYHKVPKHGAVGAVSSWVTTCGWRFAAAGGGAEAVESLPAPLHYKFMCGKCFKAERLAAKSSL